MQKKMRQALVPEQNNDYTPSLIQRFAMGGMALLVVLSFAATNIHALLWQGSDWLVGAVLPAVVTSLTNDERASVDAVPLKRSAALDAAATLKAKHMAAEGYFAHYSPGGISPWYWFEQVGYSYVHAGENLAVHFSDSDEVVEAWMNSPTHRANIVNSNYSEIGIGVARGEYEGFETVFVVQMFGAPAVPETLSVATEQPVISPITILPVATTSESELVVAVSTSSSEVLGIETYLETPAMVPESYDLPVADVSTAEEPISESVPTPSAELLVAAQELSAPVPYMTDTIATSTNLEPASSSVEAGYDTSVSEMAQLATKPNAILHYIYIGIGGLTALVLLLSIVVGWRRGRVVQVWYGVGLLLVISILFYIHTLVTAGARII